MIFRCYRGPGNREAQPISCDMIHTTAQAAARGKRFLDDPSQGGYHTVQRKTIRVPHKGAGILPGTFVSVTSTHLGWASVLARVSSYKIQVTHKAVWAVVDLEYFV